MKTKMKMKMKAFLQSEEGLTIVEYAVAAGLITAAVAGTFTLLGDAVDAILVILIGYITP